MTGGILLRFLYLDADPYYYEWVGYVTDEGRWVQHGRSLALYGILIEGNGLHFFIAPLFELVNYALFQLAGVSFLSSRIFTALCGSALLVLVWGCLRRVVTSQALLLGLTLLAFQADVVVLSRLATPEMVLMFFQLMIYFSIVSSVRSSRRMIAAGMLMLALAAMKLNMLMFLVIFSVMILFMPRKTVNATDKWRDLKLFWLGFAVPAAVIGSAGYFFLPLGLHSLPNQLPDLWSVINRFLLVSSVYNVISFPFTDTLSPTFNLWALGVWLSVLGWAAADRDKLDFMSHRHLTTLAIWITLYLVVMLTAGYFPSRYKVHILVPMALFIAVGTSLVQRVGIGKIIDHIGALKGATKFLWLAALGLPIAGLLSPLLGASARLFEMDAEKVRIKLVCFFLSYAVILFLLYRFKHKSRFAGCFLIFPIVGAMTWAFLSTTVSGYSFWPSTGLPFHALWWSLTLLAAVGVSVIVTKFVRRWQSTGCAFLITACAMFYLVISLFRISPGYLHPQYTMRAASRDLGLLLPPASTIVTVAAESLFNENKLPYRNFFAVNWPEEKPEILVVAFRHEWVKEVVEQEYHLMKTYDIFVSPEYDRSSHSAGVFSPKGVVVTVYKKNDTGPKKLPPVHDRRL